MTNYTLTERACLMRLSAGLPGKSRKDQGVTESVKASKQLGRDSGSWIKQKFPKWALEPLEKKVNEARAYHAAVTLPFDAGIGILPAALIAEYGDRMRLFKAQFENLRDSHFRAKYPDMIEWAKAEHNGTFDPSDYPPVEEVLASFQFRTEVLPVPEANHFTATISSLLGTDADGVTTRVQDAMAEGMRELMRRLIAPVKAMADKLKEVPKGDKADIVFRDSLIGNVMEIADLAPKLNISGDPQIDAFAKAIAGLGNYTPDKLRKDKLTREEAAKAAGALVEKLSAYKL